MENMVLESEVPNGLHFESLIPGNVALGRFAMEHTSVTSVSSNRTSSRRG